ncbi:hypothetical protein EMIHUDRAFT_107954 [Emiliania huxleyi CCMP1516]|uniref:Uncharacterized protein n=2 Tax=Emiliania huxleyi TaxID=2903 RepID=A0A0D3HYM0_EMIH1|nr:hypothetical protein EMIHUDRAFT_107954 [Emiliania huxleyi CCMP1516]EOD04105.1 hypothetical protein EMIHUDRAFT_107954 [Emiliania huxleyi CCMP1516]|eukprot:XP_005756534.1 hypothetical protein EMIHUDRAFT_107954 [Emiliania huxleyi CCMP1516]
MSWPRSSFAAHKLTEVEDSDTTLLHHLTRLQQAYQSRLPPTLAEDENLGFDLNAGRAGAQARLALLFDPKDRKQRLGPETAQAVFRALTGPNAQGACWKGWRQSGFGETQVSGPRAAVVHAEAIVACFERLWGQPAVCEGVPTTILRPPRSAALGAHVDSASLLELYVECRSLALAATRAAGATESLERQWAALHGCQALPSVSRFLARGGPVFAPFFSKAALLALNEVLAALELPAANAAPTRPGVATAAWLQRLESRGKLAELRLVLRAALPPDGPVVPAPMVPAAAAGDARGESCAGGWQYPLCVTWLRGFPHMAREGGLRLTFVPCLLPRPPATAAGLERMETIEAERRRTLRRAQLMQQGEYAAIRADSQLSRPIAGGAVHSHPEQEEQMHRDYDRSAYATVEELQAYDLLTARLNARAVEAMRLEMEGGEDERGREASGQKRGRDAERQISV